MSVKDRRNRTTKGSIAAPSKKSATSAPASKTPAKAAVAAPVAPAAPVIPVAPSTPPPVNATPKTSPVAASTKSYYFGALAQRLLNDIRPDVTVIACDGTDAELALAKAVELRQAGIPFYVAPLLPDRLASAAHRAAILTLEQLRDADDLRAAFEALATGTFTVDGRLITESASYPPPLLQTMRELYQMGDALLVRSHTERARLEALFHRSRPQIAVCPTPRRDLPNVIADTDANEVVVWAPNTPVQELAMHLYALATLKRPAIFICQNTVESTMHRFATLDQAEAILKRTAVLIDADLTDPSVAIGFAGRNMSVLCARTSGAHESLQNVVTYDPTNFYSIYGGVARARAGRKTTRRPQGNDVSILRSILADAQPQIPSPAPLVSIVVPTYNRRRHLERNLNAFAKQTYPNFEVVVVNDAGEAVDDIVAKFPFARLIINEQNVGCVPAINIGFRAAAGTLLGALADDDLQYPGHIASLVSAITMSATAVVHSDIILRLETKIENDRPATYGYILIHDNDTDPLSVHWGGSCSHAAGYLATREAWESIGYFNENCKNTSDLDSIISFSDRFDFGHVPVVTGEMGYPDDKSNQSAKAGVALADEVYGVMRAHNIERRLVQERMVQSAQGIANAQAAGTFFSPWIRLSNPIPVE